MFLRTGTWEEYCLWGTTEFVHIQIGSYYSIDIYIKDKTFCKGNLLNDNTLTLYYFHVSYVYISVSSRD